MQKSLSEMTLQELMKRWGCNLVMDPGHYAGRGPRESDLNSDMLEAIYRGIKQDVGEEQATNFVRFVNLLDDLSASAFIVALERFWESGCTEVRINQHPADRDRITGYGAAAEGQALAVVVAALTGGRKSDQEVAYLSIELKRRFILRHQSKIPSSERRLLGLRRTPPLVFAGRNTQHRRSR